MSEVEIRVRNRTFLRFGIVAVVVLAAFALRQFMVNYLGLDLPAFITFYPAVMLVAMLAGFWPGLLATVLASLLADYWIFPPIGSFAIAGTSNVVRWAFFAGTGVFMSLVAERYRRNQQRMAAYEREQALRESKEKLLRSEEQFETLANAIPQLCWMANPDGWIFWYNQRWYDYTGTTPEQMEGWRWRSVHDPEKLPKVLEQWKASIATGEPFDMVFPLRDADGAFRPFLTRVMPVKGPKGEVVRWFGTNTDISAQKQAEEELREREMLLRTVTESSRVGLVMLSADRHYLYANAAYAEVLGLSTPDIIGKRVPDVMGHVYDQISPRLDRAFAGERVNYELKVPAQQGTGVEGRNRFYAITYEPLQGHGEGSRVIVVVVEITERKQAEEALRSSQARMQGIIGSAMDAVISVDERQRIIVFNRAAEAVFQCAAAEAVGSTLDRFIPKSLREVHHEHIRLFGSAGVTARSMNSPGILAAVRSNGEEFPIEATISQLQAEGEKIYTVILRDITVRKQAHEALRESEERYRNLFNTMNEGFCIIEMIFDGEGKPADYRFLQVNPAFERQTGLHEAEGKLMRELAPAHEAHWFEIYGRVAITGEPVHFLNEARALNRWYHVHAYRVGEPEMRRVAIIFNDFSDYQRAQQALQASEDRWATTLQSIGDAVISTDAAGNIEFMNDVAQNLTGWSLPEAKGHDLSAAFNIVQEVTRVKPENPVAKVIRLGKVVGLANHTALIRRDGTEIPIEDSGAPIRNREGQIEGVVLVFHDVSEQRKVEKALRNSDRLATTGRLAATIAHEIHNPLDSVGNLLFLIGQATPEESTRQYVSMASQELVRVTQMTQQMLSFQREAAKPIPVKIKDILDNVIALYDRKIQSAGIKLKQQVDFDGHILALPGELRQMFANLVGNAIEAVGPRRGTITLRAYASRDWRRERSGLRVIVADDGPGIPADVRTSIFEPFFTTKGESGTGLGLWITSDILRKYDGTMRLRTSTQPRRSGTCFSVFFPFETSADSPQRA